MRLQIYLIITALIISVAAPVQATYVKPHVTKNGTFVSGHYRTKANGTKLDNISTYKNGTKTYNKKPKIKKIENKNL